MRILQLFGEPLSTGGQESFVMNIYRNINKEKIQFDFYTPFYCDNEKLKEEVINLGGKVYTGNGEFVEQGNKKDFIKNVTEFLKSNKYEIVHIHSGSIFFLAFGAEIAKKSGAKKIIVHSHATGNDNIKHKIIKNIATPIFLKYATDYCACSKIAAEWKFPKKIIKNNKYVIINNGIDLNTFLYSDEIRENCRRNLNIENNFVITNVGRLVEPKNQRFIVKLLPAIAKKIPNVKLLLVGEGIDKEYLKNLVKQLEVEKNVEFVGIYNNVSEILQASDIFIFPSKFEGLGMVAIEAQATGLPIICSNNIPEEANLTDIFYKLDLQQSEDEWINKIIEIKNRKINRIEYNELINKNGFNANTAAKIMEKIYSA